MTPEKRLKGRTVIVTGAASGIGAAVATRLCQEGSFVVAVDIRQELLSQTIETIQGSGGEIVPLLSDVCHEETCEQAAEEALATTGRIDGLVIAAGIIFAGLVHETSLHDWNLLLQTNLTGAFLSMRAVLPTMIQQGSGSIVSISSISARIIGAGGSSACYECSKAALSQLTRAVAVEYAEYGIRANTISPGKVSTRLGIHERENNAILFTSARTRWRRSYKEPLIRQCGDPAEIAALTALLVGDDVRFMNGSDISIDGGYTAI